MQKDEIFGKRRELKTRSHAVIRSHYFILVFLMLVMSLFGTEFSLSTTGWEQITQRGDTEWKDVPGSILELDNIISLDAVYEALLEGRVEDTAAEADIRSEQLAEESRSSKMFGMTNGVLARVVDVVASGKLFVGFARRIRMVTHSDEAAAWIFLAAALLISGGILIFIRNVYSAIIRRIYLQARVYNKVHFMDVTFFAAVKKWVNVAWVLLVTDVRLLLWCLTIVGGVIKYFSYWAVPYIVAENPAISAKEAITLSRRMMDGHKLELVKYKLTLLGWLLLAGITFGVSDLVYGASYRLACDCEFYAQLRRMAIENGVEGTEALNDRYLFEQADRILLYETYFEVVDEITVLHENKVELTGWEKRLVDWFGIWIGRLKKKKAYDEQEGRRYAVSRYKLSMAGEAYPQWLSPLWRRREMEKHGSYSYLRNYTIWALVLLFVTFSFVGWSWEVALHFLQTGQFANRGTLHGPWLPIYGTGGVVVLLVCSRFRKKPVLEFITSIILCGVLEYVSAWYLETKYHQRWWSYDGYFLNLHGRICAEGLLVFGVGCCTVVYLLAPMFDYLLSKIKARILVGVSIVLSIVYIGDFLYSSRHPNVVEGAVEAPVQQAQTLSETEQVSETEAAGA